VPGYAASKGAIGQLTRRWPTSGLRRRAGQRHRPGTSDDNTTALQADPVRNPAILSRIPAALGDRTTQGAVVFLARGRRIT